MSVPNELKYKLDVRHMSLGEKKANNMKNNMLFFTKLSIGEISLYCKGIYRKNFFAF